MKEIPLHRTDGRSALVLLCLTILYKFLVNQSGGNASKFRAPLCGSPYARVANGTISKLTPGKYKMQTTGSWKAAASALVAVCLVWTQLELKVWAEDAGNNLKIVLADGKQEKGREIRVKVRNGDAAASGAQVVFNLPSTGPGGLFANGSRSVTVLADEKGTASSGTIQLNNEPGPFTVLVAATQGGATGQATVQKSNPTADKGKHSFLKKKWILIGAAVVAGAVAIVLVSNREPKADVTIGMPTIGAPQ
jgi:hypothetical protein